MLKQILQNHAALNASLKNLVLRMRPKNLLVVMALVIFVVETLVMFILSEIPPLSRGWEAILDSSILLLLLTPFYLYIYRPFWEERQKQSRQIRFLSQQLLTATDEESKRIAHEIHDQCGQTLTALQFGLQSLKRLITDCDPKALERTEYLEKAACQLSGELRSLTKRLRPAILDQAGLLAALNSQAEEFRQNYPGITVTSRFFQKADLPQRLPSQTEDAIYRICQEALTNIARHASATEVSLSLSLENRCLQLEIADNGSGFDLAGCLDRQEGACGIGLLGMRERAAMVGGQLKIISRPGQGTTISASFPTNME